MVQRYRPDSDEEGRSFEMIPDDGGDYVAYEDYEELEAENDNYDSVIEIMEKQVTALIDENRRLQLMNPCNHTGFESAPCDVCGYPDPRKLIAKLEAANKRLREALQAIATGDRSAHEAMLWAREAMREASHDDHAK